MASAPVSSAPPTPITLHPPLFRHRSGPPPARCRSPAPAQTASIRARCAASAGQIPIVPAEPGAPLPAPSFPGGFRTPALGARRGARHGAGIRNPSHKRKFRWRGARTRRKAHFSPSNLTRKPEAGVRVVVRVAAPVAPESVELPPRLPLVVVETGCSPRPEDTNTFRNDAASRIVRDANRISGDDSRGPTTGRIRELTHTTREVID